MVDEKKSWWRREWEELRPHLKFRLLEFVFGGGVLAAIIASMRHVADEPVTWRWLVLLFVISVIGYAVISLYLRSQREKTRMSSAMMTYLPIILGLLFCVWAYFIGTTLYRLSHEAQSLRSNLDLYVRPRTVTQEQISSMAAYLSQYDPHDIQVIVHANDAEASNYMGQIAGGLIRGGWKIVSTGYIHEQMNQGISINTEQPGQPQNSDPKHPTPELILQRALQQANIPVSGGGGSYNRPAYSITIAIGPRQLVIDTKPPVRVEIPPPPGWQ
jgi:hypothetical protein